jgi:hypothetical protein
MTKAAWSAMAQRIAELEALLLKGLALHGATAFTASEIEWREAARRALDIKS